MVGVTTPQKIIEQIWLFGDGEDGDVTISADTTIDAIKRYKNLTINVTKTLSTNTTKVLAIIVKETLTVNGIISVKGKGANGGAGAAEHTGTAGSAGSVGSQGKISGGCGGGGGSCVSTSVHATDGTCAGAGAGALDGYDGGAGGGIVAKEYTDEQISQMAIDYLTIIKNRDYLYGSGGAGGGSGSDNGDVGSNGGGNGGKGGGGILIFAEEIVIGATGTITAEGEDGSDGMVYVGNSGQGGGGAGGSGGLLYIVSGSLTNGDSITVGGGNGGVGGTGNSPHDAGNGSNGSAGKIIIHGG